MSIEIHHKLEMIYKNHKGMLRLLALNGSLDLHKKARQDFFVHLSQIVVGQQLSNAASNSIWARIEKLAANQQSSLYDVFRPEYHHKLRACGISRSKIKAIAGLREATGKNNISEEIFTSTDHVIITTEITKLWGFGKWSAEMVALSFFGLPNIWSDDDAALIRAITIIANDGAESAIQLIDMASPYKSYLAMHLWKAIDNKII